MADDVKSSDTIADVARAERSTWRSRVAFIARVLQVRLRFIVVLAAIFVVLGLWNYLTQVTESLITRLTGTGARPEHVSPDTEYFCPMCPGVLSNWPEKCPVCKMPLVRRRKGDATLLPEGVLARMQLTPQRLQLAGVHTSAAQYQPLEKTWHCSGHVELGSQALTSVRATLDGNVIGLRKDLLWQPVAEGEVLATLRHNQRTGSGTSTAEQPDVEILAPRAGHVLRVLVSEGDQIASGDALAELADVTSIEVVCRVSQEDLPLVYVGQHVNLRLESQTDLTPIDGHVTAIQPTLDHPAAGAGVRITAASADWSIRPGSVVTVQWRVPLADIEPFRSLPHDPTPLTANETRDVFHCSDHPSYLYAKPGECPFDEKPLEHHPLAAHQRLEWHCPAHATAIAKQPGACEQCSGLPLVPTVVSYRPKGQVLAIPDSAVIENGSAQIVFVETGPGMFDAVAVHLGPRSDSLRSVVSGIEAGQLVVTAGAFLLDAETRLTSNLSAAYFGAGSRTGSSTTSVIGSASESSLPDIERMKVPASDAVRIRTQRTCPVTGLMLGSMGTPIRIGVGDHIVYLCCSGCKSKIAGAVDLPISTPAEAGELTESSGIERNSEPDAPKLAPRNGASAP